MKTWADLGNAIWRAAERVAMAVGLGLLVVAVALYGMEAIA